MKCRKIEKVPLKVPVKGAQPERQATAQVLDDRYLILDLWEKSGRMRCRHVMDRETGEPGTYYPDTGKWTKENLDSASGNTGWHWGESIREEEWHISREDAALIKGMTRESWRSGIYARITEMESTYNEEKRKNAMQNKEKRLRELMACCPGPGPEVYSWITQRAAGDTQYAFLSDKGKSYHCTSCGGDFPRTAAGKKVRNKDMFECPLCGSRLFAEHRRKRVEVSTRLTMIHDLDEKRGVERHFRVTIEWDDSRKTYLEETIRLMMQRGMKHPFTIYYEDWGGWSEGNHHNYRWGTGFLYPDREKIQEGLRGTAYGPWVDVMPMLAEAGIEADYNGLLVESNMYWTRIAEYLAKGRFYRLLKEESEMISPWCGYTGRTLRINGTDMGEVLRLKDKQLSNRLRDEDGGRNMLSWLQWSEKTGKKISTGCLRWFEKAGISPQMYAGGISGRYLSPEQLMNYIERQRTESYPRKGANTVYEQYEDYLSMAAGLRKRLDDAMVHRPRELKRRHDELVEESHKKQMLLEMERDREKAQEEAERMRQKDPDAEEILQEIKGKLEYSDGTYQIMVPRDFFEITMEGAALHHCAGATERYFDRIMQRETYICFLRRTEEPEVPYYTIEVEPGGTIRQHRGYMDEEPGIEEIKPFLRAWQKEIRQRMKGKDFEHAERSAVLREKNMEELREKNNTRVLEGLMEDLMEVG